MADQFLFDPTAEATGTQLDISASPYRVMEFSSPGPGQDTVTASGIDVEGAIITARGDQNRQVSLAVEVDPSSRTQPNLDAAVATLEAKVSKMRREGGTLRRVRADGTYRTFDILASDSYEKAFNVMYDANVAQCQISLVAAPFARGAEVTGSSHSETSLPVLVFTETGIAGDVPATGRLVVTDAQGVSQNWATWGVESLNYSSSANAALFYQAEGRTALSTSAIAVGTAGASGAASNVMKNTALTTSWQAVMSTQATGGGAHLSHVGKFKVYARCLVPSANVGTTTIALQWGLGDFNRPTQNTGFDLSQLGQWQIADLGLVSLSRIVSGTQKWEGRILAKSTTAGDDIEIDCLWLVPVAEGSGEAVAVATEFVPTAYVARDEFNQTAGALSGKTLPVGGTWSGAGSATDGAVIGTYPAFTVQRDSVADVDDVTGRYMIAGTTASTDVVVSSKVSATTAFGTAGRVQAVGVFGRYVDTNNWGMAYLSVVTGSAPVWLLVVRKRVAGTMTVLATKAATEPAAIPSALGGVAVALTTAVTFTVRASGAWEAKATGNQSVSLSGYDAAFATGGALASGKSGLYGYANNTILKMWWDDFWVATPPSDAAIYASQSIEFRDNGVYREDSAGSFLTRVSRYEGDNLRIPPAGLEGRTTRFIVKASRFYPSGPDNGIDDISAQLIYTPRYLNVT